MDNSIVEIYSGTHTNVRLSMLNGFPRRRKDCGVFVDMDGLAPEVMRLCCGAFVREFFGLCYVLASDVYQTRSLCCPFRFSGLGRSAPRVSNRRCGGQGQSLSRDENLNLQQTERDFCSVPSVVISGVAIPFRPVILMGLGYPNRLVRHS